jgi:glycosyltransferase involved in cell wall biosynthesis
LKLDIIIPVGPGHEDLVNEAINSVKIACLTSQGPFTEVRIKAVDDTKGEMGRSAARNHAIKASQADWLFFLDADDLMHPHAMLNMNHSHEFYDAVWGLIVEENEGCLMDRFQLPVIENMKSLLAVDPYYTLQMGFFVRRGKMPLFDETMNCGEDWKAYLELWRNHKCTKVPQPFMINRRGRHSTGPRSATGRDWMIAVKDLIENERKKLPA